MKIKSHDVLLAAAAKKDMMWRMLLRDLEALTHQARGGVVAIGNFDGVHRGHQYLLEQARQKADSLGCPLTVLSFEPHPRLFFAPDSAPFRIAPQRVKEQRLQVQGVDHVVMLPFNQALANMKAEDFIDTILKKALDARAVVVGKGFRFGYKRLGDTDMIRARGLEAMDIQPLTDERGDVVSSTRIREALKDARIETANSLLGWEWYIRGEVVHGDKRGRELGYPTANIWLEETICPSYGIYAVKVRRGQSGQEWLYGAANIGIRPMFETRMPLLEVYLFDFDDDLYGEVLHVQPVAKIRDEAKFDSLDELIAQMQRDCEKARTLLA